MGNFNSGRLQSHRGVKWDIFFTYERLFEIFTDFSKDKKQKVILKNLVRNIKANDDLVSDYLLNRFNGFSEFKEITKLFNKEKLKYKSDADVECLSQILTQVLKNAILRFCYKQTVRRGKEKLSAQA